MKKETVEEVLKYEKELQRMLEKMQFERYEPRRKEKQELDKECQFEPSWEELFTL